MIMIRNKITQKCTGDFFNKTCAYIYLKAMNSLADNEIVKVNYYLMRPLTSKEEQKIVEKYALDSYGLLANQEQFMVAVQDPALGGWDLIFGDKLRKSVAKKLPKDFIELQNQFFDIFGLLPILVRYIPIPQ